MDGLRSVDLVSRHSAATQVRPRDAQHPMQDPSATDELRPGHHGPDHAPGANTGDGVVEAARTTDLAASYRRQDKTSLQIRTADGDVVRLKFKSVTSADLDSRTRESESSTSSEVHLEISQRTRLSMSVRGELDADEHAAIHETIARAGEIASDFYAGDMQAAFDDADALGITSEEISSVRLRMKTTEQLTYSARSVVRAGPDAESTLPGTVSDAPGAPIEGPGIESRPPTEAEGITTDVPDPAADATDATDPTDPTDPTETDGSERSDAPTRTSTVGTLAEFLDGLLTKIGSETDDAGFSAEGTFARSISMSLKLRIVESVLVTAAASERPSEPLPAIVSESIDDLVATEQPALETVA